MSDELQNMIDRQKILDCMHRYCRGVDRLDKDLILSAFHPDAMDFHGSNSGSPLKFIETLWPKHATRSRVMHILGNHMPEINGNTAHSETQWLTTAIEDGSDEVSLTGGRYVDRFEKRSGEWKIAVRVVVIEWRTSGKSGTVAGEFVTPHRSPADVSYLRPLEIAPVLKILGKA